MMAASPVDKTKHDQRILHIEGFLKQFFKLVQMTGLHETTNKLVIRCAVDFCRSFERLIGENPHLTLQTYRGNLFIQNEKLLYRRKNTAIIQKILLLFRDLEIRGLRFHSKLHEVPAGNLIDFFHLLNSAWKGKKPVSWLDDAIESGRYPWAEIILELEKIPDAISSERMETARKIYSYAMASVKRVSMNLSSRQNPGFNRCMRLIQNVVDLIMEDESIILGLSTIRNYDDYTCTHSVNVAFLALCLGYRIKLSRSSMVRLGISALFHDIGKVDISRDILNKPGKLTAEEFEEVKKHSINGVHQILKFNISRELKCQFILPPFEHHLKYDLSGYPQSPRKKPVSIHGSIITIADVYDALSTPRIYRQTALSPDKALSMMWNKCGKDFDPVLLKVFINMIGVYPVGTLLLLDTGEKALVTHCPVKNPGAPPEVVLLKSNGTGGYLRGDVVRLSEKDPRTGMYRRTIAASAHPSTFGIQPALFII